MVITKLRCSRPSSALPTCQNRCLLAQNGVKFLEHAIGAVYTVSNVIAVILAAIVKAEEDNAAAKENSYRHFPMQSGLSYHLSIKCTIFDFGLEKLND